MAGRLGHRLQYQLRRELRLSGRPSLPAGLHSPAIHVEHPEAASELDTLDGLDRRRSGSVFVRLGALRGEIPIAVDYCFSVTR